MIVWCFGVRAAAVLLFCFDVGFFPKLNGDSRAAKVDNEDGRRGAALGDGGWEVVIIGEEGSTGGVGDSGKETAAACNVSFLANPFRKLAVVVRNCPTCCFFMVW